MVCMPATRSQSTRRFDSLEQQAYLNLWRTYDRLRALEDQMFESHGITAQQYNALRLLEARFPSALPTLQLARRLISRAPDITRMVDRMAKRGWVTRERSAENRRVVHVRITGAGRQLLRRLAAEVVDCHKRQLGHLSPTKLRRLIGLLAEARQPHEPLTSPWRHSLEDC
jgi:DNA-binding MarR family transcriptional regulator